MYTYAGPEIAVASTKAYMVQMCVLYLFALRLAYARGRLSEAETRRFTAQLLRAPEVIKPRLADCEQIKYLASRYVNTQSCFFIGRGFDYALSLEGSLKRRMFLRLRAIPAAEQGKNRQQYRNRTLQRKPYKNIDFDRGN